MRARRGVGEEGAVFLRMILVLYSSGWADDDVERGSEERVGQLRAQSSELGAEVASSEAERVAGRSQRPGRGSDA